MTILRRRAGVYGMAVSWPGRRRARARNDERRTGEGLTLAPFRTRTLLPAGRCKTAEVLQDLFGLVHLHGSAFPLKNSDGFL